MFAIFSVAKKEWLDALRDRRAIVSTLFYSIVGPLLIFMMLNGLAREEGIDVPVQLAIIGSDYDSRLSEEFNQRDFKVSFETGAFAPHLAEEYDAVLVISENFSSSLKTGRAGRLDLYVDPATDYGARAVEGVQRVVSRFSSAQARSRLLVHGVNPELMNPVDLQIRNIGENSAFTMVITRLLVLFFIMAPFFASLSVASI